MNVISDILIQLFNSNKYTGLYLGLALTSPIDQEFGKFLEVELKSNLVPIQQNPKDFENIFPKNAIIAKNTVKEFIVKFVKKTFPDDKTQKIIIIYIMVKWEIIRTIT